VVANIDYNYDEMKKYKLINKDEQKSSRTELTFFLRPLQNASRLTFLA